MFDSTHISADFDGGVLIAMLKTEKVGEYEAGIIEQELLALLHQPGCKLALDLQQVQMMSSVGLGLLISLNRHCKGKKGKFAIFGLTDPIMGVLKMTKLNGGLLIAADRAGAVKVLG